MELEDQPPTSSLSRRLSRCRTIGGGAQPTGSSPGPGADEKIDRPPRELRVFVAKASEFGAPGIAESEAADLWPPVGEDLLEHLVNSILARFPQAKFGEVCKAEDRAVEGECVTLAKGEGRQEGKRHHHPADDRGDQGQKEIPAGG